MSMKPTLGKWIARPRTEEIGHVVMCDGKVLFRTPTCRIDEHDEDHTNADLCAEAGTVYAETGKTPRELAERVKKLEAFCAEFAHTELHGETTP